MPQENKINFDERVIEIKGLKKSFGDMDVLNGIDLYLCKGENLVVLGRSGTGKSVLIKCLVRLLLPDAGSIKVYDIEVTKLDTRKLDELRLKIGFNFQHSALYDSMTVRKNLEFPIRRNGQSFTKQELDKAVEEALENVGLSHTIDTMPSELSGGMRKRIGIARTLILKPDIMLYDEPTAGLDPVTSRDINQLILDVQDIYHTSSIIITHDITCARTTGNRLMVLHEGLVAEEGSYEKVSQTKHPVIKTFFDY